MRAAGGTSGKLAARRCYSPISVAIYLAFRATGLAAQEVELKISGDITFLAGFGDLEDDQTGSDHEVFETDGSFTVEAFFQTRDPDLRWGAITEFTADTNSDPDPEKAFLFLRSPYGDPRFGLDDTTATSINYSAPFVAVGTGGLDGDILDSPELVFLTATDTDNSRIIYYSPFFENWQLGLSYSSNDETKENDDDNFDELIEGTLNYYQEKDDFEIGAALSVADAQSYKGAMLSGVVGLDEFAIAGGIAAEEVGDVQRQFYNLGIALEIEPFDTSLNWGQCVHCDDGDSWNLIGGIEVGLLPGTSTAIEVSRSRSDEGAYGTIALFSLEFEF
ncbi:MAG: porin [Pseudomonadota bacterium]